MKFDVQYIPPAPVIHPGFPSCFNLSLAEYEMYHTYDGQYLNYSVPLVFHKDQPCIRHQDWETIKNNDKDAWKYLSVFTMSTAYPFTCLPYNDGHLDRAKKSIHSLIKYLKKANIHPEDLYVSCFSGATVANATAGKYKINTFVNADPLYSEWLTVGVPKSQILPDQSRDTFLSLNIFGKPTAWGYRNEIHVKHNNDLLDIATVEHLCFKPLFDGKGNIFDLKKLEGSITVAAYGSERVEMIARNLKHICETYPINTYVKVLTNLGRSYDEACILAQAYRAIEHIVADSGSYSQLNKRRKSYLSKFYRVFLIPENFKGINQDELNVLLSVSRIKHPKSLVRQELFKYSYLLATQIKKSKTPELLLPKNEFNETLVDEIKLRSKTFATLKDMPQKFSLLENVTNSPVVKQSPIAI